MQLTFLFKVHMQNMLWLLIYMIHHLTVLSTWAMSVPLVFTKVMYQLF